MPPPALPRRAFAVSALIATVAAIPAAATEPTQYRTTKRAPDGAPVELVLYRRRPATPGPHPVLFLVHGSSASALPTFDLTVPGQSGYSLMDETVAWGFDTWTMDHEGYGRSARTAGNSDIASGVADLAAAADVIGRETGQPRMDFLGESSGALRAGAFAEAHPDRAGRLVLVATTYTGAGSDTLTKRAQQLEFYRTHTRRPRDRAMLRSIFTRDHPGTTDPAVADAFADAELPYGDSIPAGTYLDMTANLPVVHPDKLRSPVLIIRGEYDGIATLDDLLDFYRKLPNGDRAFVIIPSAAHSLVTCRMRQAFYRAVRGFLTQPTIGAG